jgi:quinol monooxygenase YgiN
MISIVAKWSILQGQEKAAVSALKILARAVQKEEPFVSMYTIHVPDFSATSFPTPSMSDVVFFSVFKNKAAFQKHLKGPVFQGWLAKYGSHFLMNNDNLFVVSEFLARQAGFVRQEMVTPARAPRPVKFSKGNSL